jgi:hypothetical protein
MWGFGPDVATVAAPATTVEPPASARAAPSSSSTGGTAPSHTPAAAISDLDHPVDGVAFSISVPAFVCLMVVKASTWRP